MKRTITPTFWKQGLIAALLLCAGYASRGQVSSFPWTEDFSTADSWTLSNGEETNRWFTGSAAGNPANGLYISDDEGLSNEYDNTSYSVVHAYADIEFPADMTAISFSFDWRADGESGYDYLRVWFVPATYTPTAGTLITASASGGTQYGGNFNGETTWQTENFVLPASYAGATMRLVFEWKNDGSAGDDPPAAVDNVSIILSSCSQPVDLTVTDISAESAVLGWTEEGSATEWRIEYGETGFAPGTGATVLTTENPYEITGLDPSTTYDFYVRSLCTGDSSALSGPYSFNTDQIPATLPFEETWDGDNEWTILNGTQPNKWFVGSAAGNPANSVYISNDGGASNEYSVSSSSVVQVYRDISFPADALESTLTFDWKGEGESTYDYMRVWIVPVTFTPTPGTQITASASGGTQYGVRHNLESEWQTTSYILPAAYAGQTMRLVFEWRNDGSVGTQPPMAVDNISIIADPCPRPDALTLDSLSATDAIISWSESGSAGEWYIEYGPSGFAPGTGTAATTDTTSYILSGLSASTSYDFYVRAICSDTDSSELAGPLGFSTLQIPAELPFLEEWDEDPQWTAVNGTQPNKWHTGNATGSPANSAYISNDNGVSNAYTVSTSSVVQIYRDITIPEGTTGISCSFDWKADGESGYDYLRVWVVPASFMPVAGTQITASASGGTQYGGNFNGESTWQTESLSFPDSYAGQTIRLVFEWRNDGSVGTQPPAAIDNINVTGIIPCPEPTAVSVTEVTATTAMVSWISDEDPDSWEINYGPAGFTPGTETIVSTTDNPYLASGLTPATSYDFYVRALCPTGSVSDWVGPVTVVTECILPSVISVTADTICGPGYAEISATASEGASLVWLDDADAAAPLYSGTTYSIGTVTATTTYYVVATLSAGVCRSEPVPVTVVVHPLPEVSLGSDTAICAGNSLTLTAPAGYEYLWNTGDTTLSVTVAEAGSYSVTVTDQHHCTGSDEINIDLLPLPGVEGFNFVPYFTTGTLSVGFEALEPQHVDSYFWDFGDGAYSTEPSPIHVFDESSAYTVMLVVANGCGTDTVVLDINVDMNTGITQQTEGSIALTLYPNPSKDMVTIAAEDNLQLKEISVYNIAGAVVYRGNAGGGTLYHLPVDNLSAGIYSVSIQTDKGIVIRKIQVMH